MNLDNITNVNDLLEENEAPSDADVLMKECLAAGVTVGHEVTVRLVQANISLHKRQLAEKCKEEEVDPKAVFLWTQDLTRLEAALALLEDVDVG